VVSDVPISYRDLELMLLDRGVEVDHTTIFRWIQAVGSLVTGTSSQLPAPAELHE
jgi:transposase-like protein